MDVLMALSDSIAVLHEGKLIADDTPETIKRRLTVYEKETKPLLKFYRNKLIMVKGDNTISRIFREIKLKLER